MNSKTEIITWSRYHLSLLCSFRYIFKKKENKYLVMQLDKEGNPDFVTIITKPEIVEFLIFRGHNIKLGSTMQKQRMDFGYHDKPIQYYR